MTTNEISAHLVTELRLKMGADADGPAMITHLLECGTLRKRDSVAFVARERMRRDWRNYLGRIMVLCRIIATDLDIDPTAVHKQSVLIAKGKK